MSGALSYSMPDYSAVRIPPIVVSHFWVQGRSIGVSRIGDIAVLGTAGQVSGRFLHLLPQGEEQVLATGRSGQGPGGLSSSGRLFAQDQYLTIIDDRRHVAIRYNYGGKFIEEFRLPGDLGFVLAAHQDSLDVMKLHWGDSPDAPLVSRVALRSGSGRPLVTASDTFVKRMMENPNRLGSTRKVLVYGSSFDRFAIVDPLTYSIHVYTNDGQLIHRMSRAVSPLKRDPIAYDKLREAMEIAVRDAGGRAGLGRVTAERLDTLDRESLPHVHWPGVGWDSAGRLLIVGTTGDSTFVDVFADSTFVGRQSLPCRQAFRQVAIGGVWITLQCEAPDSEQSPVAIQLYRQTASHDTTSE